MHALDPQPIAAARRADFLVHEPAEPFLDERRFGLLVPLAERRAHPGKLGPEVLLVFRRRAFQQHLANAVGQGGIRHMRRHAEVLAEAPDLPAIDRPHRRRQAVRMDRPFRQRLGVVGHHQLARELHHHAQPMAFRTRPVRRVEREQPRRQLFQRALRMVGTRELVAVDLIPPRRAFLDRHHHRAVGELQGRLDRFGQPLPQRRLASLEHQPIDHGVHIVLHVTLKAQRVLPALLQGLADLDQLAVGPHAPPALALQ